MTLSWCLCNRTKKTYNKDSFKKKKKMKKILEKSRLSVPLESLSGEFTLYLPRCSCSPSSLHLSPPPHSRCCCCCRCRRLGHRTFSPVPSQPQFLCWTQSSADSQEKLPPPQTVLLSLQPPADHFLEASRRLPWWPAASSTSWPWRAAWGWADWRRPLERCNRSTLPSQRPTDGMELYQDK